jgi:carboxyl-terminal processing protease
VLTVYANSSASETDLRSGDLIYGVEIDGEVKTVNELGYTGTLNAIKGETGTKVKIAVLRPTGEDAYTTLTYEIERRAFEKQSVSGKVSQTDPSVGIISMVEFDLVAPKQLKETVLDLKSRGIQKFVFDLRNNPGGDLLSIKAILSYFLQKGDILLQSIDRNNNVKDTHKVEVVSYEGRYADCSVAESEIGMFADLDMVVLCNGNTASAAEVFTASLRDYQLATVVGETTFGKGIMQSYVALSAYGDYDGYFKMTTYAYVTKCGVTYHEVGITPHVQVAQSEAALQYNPYLLPETMDDQLIAAIGQFQN